MRFEAFYHLEREREGEGGREGGSERMDSRSNIINWLKSSFISYNERDLQ